MRKSFKRSEQAAVLLLTSFWTVIFLSPVIGPNSRRISVAVLLGLGIGVGTIWLNSRGDINRTDVGGDGVFWRDGVLFGVTALSTVVIFVVGLGISTDIFGITPGNRLSHIIQIGFAIGPPGIAAIVVKEFRSGQFSVPGYLLVNRWTKTADLGLLLLVSLLTLTYSQSLLPADATVLAPALNLVALFIGLMHVALRRTGAFQDATDRTEPVAS